MKWAVPVTGDWCVVQQAEMDGMGQDTCTALILTRSMPFWSRVVTQASSYAHGTAMSWEVGHNLLVHAQDYTFGILLHSSFLFCHLGFMWWLSSGGFMRSSYRNNSLLLSTLQTKLQ